jgi:CO dehydrogenase maturation factor
LLIVTDPSQRGIVAAERIAGFRKELDIHIEHAYLILNRVTGEIPEPIQTRINELDIPLLAMIPISQEITDLDFRGQPLIEVGDDATIYQKISAMMRSIL